VGWSGYLCFLKTETSVRRLNNPVSSMHYYPKTSSQLPCVFWASFHKFDAQSSQGTKTVD